jgi:hypothetical protein
MAKRLDITAEIEATIRKNTGDATLVTSSLAVFETILADTKQINKRGSLFDKGRITQSMLGEMAAYVTAGNTIPLQLMHDPDELPQGRVFSAWLSNLPDGDVELRGQFFLPLDRVKLVADIENSVIDSVSIGAKSSKVLCSECGWDYSGPDATFMNIMDRVCANDHVIGENGTHVRMVGLDTWYETSLVGTGGVTRAKIQPRHKSQASERLAASGIPLDSLVLTASFKDSTKKGLPQMDLSTLVDQLSGVKAELTLANGKVTTMTADIATLTASAATAAARIAELEAQLAAAPNGTVITELTNKVTAAEAAVATLTSSQKSTVAFLKTHAEAAQVASGAAKVTLSDDPAALISFITETGVKLHQAVGAGGSATSADAGNGDQGELKLSTAAFKVRK